MPVVLSSPTMATTRGPCSTTSGTRTFGTRSGTPRWRPIASGTFGVDRCRRQQARHRFPLYHLGICRRIPLGDHLLNQLNPPLDLLGCHLFERVPVLDLMLARKHHRNHLEVHSRILLAHPRDGPFAVLLEIP